MTLNQGLIPFTQLQSLVQLLATRFFRCRQPAFWRPNGPNGAFTAMSKAAVPLAQAMPCLRPHLEASLASKSFTAGPAQMYTATTSRNAGKRNPFVGNPKFAPLQTNNWILDSDKYKFHKTCNAGLGRCQRTFRRDPSGLYTICYQFLRQGSQFFVKSLKHRCAQNSKQVTPFHRPKISAC